MCEYYSRTIADERLLGFSISYIVYQYWLRACFIRYTVYMTKRLYRSKTDRKIAGVCAGLAEYFGIDPVIVRVIAVLLLLPGGLPGLIPYVILWIIVPSRPKEPSVANSGR